MGNLCSTSSRERGDSCSSNKISGKAENNEMKSAQISQTGDKESRPINDNQKAISNLKMEENEDVLALDAQVTDENCVDADCLTKNLVVLREEMVTKEVIHHLEGKNIIPRVEADEIRDEKESFGANQRVLDSIKKRGPEALHCFTTALEETEQHHLAGLLRAAPMKINDVSSSVENSIEITSTIPREPEEDMDFWYSSEKWKVILGADEAETICVPPCLDVLNKWKRDDIDEAPHLAPNILGQKGEAAFMQKFQELNLGGVLVSGLEYHEFEASRTVRNKIIKKGEWDAIFFHQKRGIFVIEVKGSETNNKSVVNTQINKAKAQLDKYIENIKQSFRTLYRKECSRITGFICFPFRKESRKIYEGYRVIDKSAMNDRAIFRKFFEAQANIRNSEVSLLQRFVAEFVRCRSKVEFHSQAYNAMKVATWIMEQDIAQKQDPSRLVNLLGNGPSGKIILTAQQLEIVECREKRVTIRGAPGSGKTLILMLRALKAAMENKAGSVFVFVNEKLKAKYEQYFFDERDNIIIDEANNIDRRPKVHTIDMINFVKLEDDVFFDETPVENSYIEEIKSRVNCSGTTTVVFTGLHKPEEAVASFRLYQPRLREFKHFELMKVLRGTGNIFEKWERYYPLDITIGHNIFGVAVKSETFDSFEQVQNEIANKIVALTHLNISSTDLPALKNEHIAVITCDDNDSTEMRNYFDTKQIPCGEVNEQARRLKSISIVAVDVYLNTPSYEWPIVFIVLKPGVTEKEVLPIAASRCIASLTIVTYKIVRPHFPNTFSTPRFGNG